MKLYELSNAYRLALQESADNDGELTPELERRLDAINEAFEAKAEACACLVIEAQREAEAWKAESDRMAKHARTCANRAERIKNYIRQNMVVTGRDRVDGKLFKIAFHQNSRPTIVWTRDPQEIPDQFRRVTFSLDGNAAYEAHKAGTLPEAFHVHTGSHLRIR